MIRSMTQQQLIEAGRESFVHNCSGCHGMDAQGAGPAAVMLNPRPRNLVAGSFKFRSTPTGTLPTSDDLMRTLDQGVLGTSMPSFRLISNQEKQALVAYIKSLRPTWSQEQGDSYAIPSPPKEIFSKKETLLASAARGRETFLQGCQTCHGDTGLGDGPSVEGLMDAENMPIRPANFTRPYIKSGRTARDVFKAITTGLDGTPMPSFADVYTPEQRWDLVAYVLYRRGQGAGIYSADLSLPSVTKKKTK
ncbi:MAG: cytochrome c [Bdellovibrionales bacterium]|nr:cytochrome c [Bdellovibrionales bacterium]